MYTFGQYVKDKVKEGVELGETRGVELGTVRGEKWVLFKFVRQVWGDSAAERFAHELNAAELHDLPDITDLIEDQAAGHLPQLRKNAHGDSRA